MTSQMDSMRDYFTLPESKYAQRSAWNNDLPSPWEPTTPGGMPIWQYTAAALQQEDPQISYYIPQESSISQYTDSRNGPSNVPSLVTAFPQTEQYVPISSTPPYDAPIHRLTHSPPQHPHLNIPQAIAENPEMDDTMEDEDSEEGYTWEVNHSSRSPPSASARKKVPRRVHSANEDVLKNAKRAHTVVERNYRERLNDKIADLALYLFETSSDSRTKPSKSLVMTRAKERLKQLEARNKALESEVTKLKQHIAILDHVVASKGGDATPIQASVPVPLPL